LGSSSDRPPLGSGVALTLRRRQWIAAGITVATALVLAAESWWPFDANLHPASFYEHPSLSQIVLSDRLTLGAVRLGITFFAGFSDHQSGGSGGGWEVASETPGHGRGRRDRR